MPPTLQQNQPHQVAVHTPVRTRTLLNPSATWSTANSIGSLAAAYRADQLTEPTFNTATGEHVYTPECSMVDVRPILRGAVTHVLTFNVWLWDQLWHGVPTLDHIVQWSPWLLGRFTATFVAAGSATAGVAAGVVLATDIYCSKLEVVALYDHRGDYTDLWKIVGQPAANEDGSAMRLVFDTLGAAKVSIEGRTTTATEGFNFATKSLSLV